MNPIAPRVDPATLFTHFQHRELNVSPEQFPGKTIYLLTDQPTNPPALADAIRIASTADLSPEAIAAGVFYIYFLCDCDALPEVSRIHHHGGIYIPHLDFSKTSYRFVERHALEALRRTEERDGISPASLNVHENICEALAMTAHLDGDYIEIGVFRGSSALTALHYFDIAREKNQPMRPRIAWLLDTFDGFNYEEATTSADAIWRGTHHLYGVEDTIAFLKNLFQRTRNPYYLVKSNICVDPLPEALQKIVVANLDVDMYEPTLAGLYKLSPKIVPGGIIICEDAASTPGLYGALLAMEEFLASTEGRHYTKIFKGGQYFLLRDKETPTLLSRIRACFRR